MKYGFIPPVIEIEKDYVFGSYGNLGGEVLQPDGKWIKYLPKGETQFNYGFEPNACVSFGTLNGVEILLNRMYGEISNFSDRFLAKVSGTTPEGNNPQAVAEALRKSGVPREELWPITSDLTTWDKFYSAIPQSIQTIALEFLSRFAFKHEYVGTSAASLKEALKYSPLGIAVSAWSKEGDYYVSNFPNNHWCTLVGYEDGKYWIIYDSYSQDGEFTKKLAWNYNFSVAKRYAINLQADVKSPAWIQFIVALFKAAFGIKYEPIPPLDIPTDDPEPATERLAVVAQSMIGKDASPKNLAPQELSCAEGVSNIIHKVFSDFPTDVLSTADLHTLLKKSPHFTSTLTPKRGCVIVSPRTAIQPGHTGIFISDTEIASNSSATGLFQNNYNFEGWIKYFRITKGLHAFIHEPI